MDVAPPRQELPPSWADGRWAAALVVAAAALLFFLRLGDRSLVSEEVRWGEVAREMRQTGDYLRPTINGVPYPDKPAGSYWLILAASALTGGIDETAARLPSAAAGVVGVWVTILLGRRLYDDRTAVYAGAVLATSFGFAFYARRATADVETVTGVLVAVWLYARFAGRLGPWVVGLWAWMAAVSLTKGLLGFALPLAVFATHGIWSAWADRDRPVSLRALLAANRWLFNRWSLLALPLAAITYLLPFLLAGADGGLGMVWRENVRRFFAPHNHVGPAYLYVGVVFVLAAPWSAFLPAALVPPGRATPGDRLARGYFWAVFAFFTASASRRSYYLLPVLPAAALLVGRTLAAAELRGAARWLRTAGWVVVAAAVVASGVALLPPAWMLPPPYDRLPPLPARGVLLAGWLVAVAAIFFGKADRVARAMAGTFLALLYLFAVAFPAADDLRPRREFLAAVRERTAGDPDRLALFHARDTVFDLDRTAAEFTTPEDLAAALVAGRVRWVVAARRHLDGVTLPAAVVAAEESYPWETEDRVANKLLLLERSP